MKKLKYQLEFVTSYLKEKNISVISENYISSKVPICCKCDICNTEWKAQFSNLKFGQGCPSCSRIRASNKHRKSIPELIELFKNKNVIPLNIETYQHAKTNILSKCKICQFEWNTTYSRLILENKGCPNCKNLKLSKTKTLSIEDVKLRLESHNIILNGIYINSTTPLKCKCKKCEHEWISSGLNYIENTNATCQNCNNLKFLSEKICRLILEDIFNVKFSKIYLPIPSIKGSKLELDGYNDELKIAFEHNGPQHYYPKWYGKSNKNINYKFEIQCKNDILKQEWCKNNNIALIIFRDLGKYTTEKNIISKIKDCLLENNKQLPPSIDTYVPDFYKIKSKIIENCQI